MGNKIDQMDDIELYFILKNDKYNAEKAFTELYNRHSPRIYSYCRKFLGNKDDAQDVFQETFVSFLETTQQDRVMTNVPGFLLKIARNLCVNVRRRDKNPVSYEDYMSSVETTNGEKEELLHLIKNAMELLPAEYKDMFILREYQGLSYTEIAEVTNTTLATVKIRIFRAKQKVREILAPYLEDIAK